MNRAEWKLIVNKLLGLGLSNELPACNLQRVAVYVEKRPHLMPVVRRLYA
jgi:hypothetical protein